MRKRIFICVFGLLAVCAFSITCYTEAYSNLRWQWNQNEMVLSSSTVVGGKFGMLASYATTDWVYAHPLYAPGVTVSGASHNLLVIADMSDYVYAFDADAVGSAYLWRTQLGTPAPSSLPDNIMYGGNMGCLATPVIDSANGWLFALCANNNTSWVVYKLNLSTGAIITQTTISASSQSITFTFPTAYVARPGLALANSNVYLSFGQADNPSPWYGWEMAYSESSLTQVGVFIVAPGGSGGGSIWQGSGGPAVDASGNIYITTGNGVYDGVSNFSMSVVKLSPTLALLDWFAPANESALSAVDADTSSGPPFLTPDGYINVGFKDWNVYHINPACMGHLGGTVGCTAPQIFPMPNQGVAGCCAGIYGRMFMNNVGYFCTASGPVYSFAFTGTSWNTSVIASTSASYVGHGLMMAGSSNGPANNLVWGISPNGNNHQTPLPGTLRAFNAATLAELWNSGTLPADNLINTPKFQVPLIANGRVYVGEQNAVAVFGLPLSTQASGSMTIGGNAVIQ